MEEGALPRETDTDSQGEGLAFWGPVPGTIGGASAFVAIVGLVVTLLMMALMLDLYAFYRHGPGATLGQKLCYQTPTLVLLAILWRRKRCRSSLGLALRTASWIPLLHLLLVACGAGIWLHITSQDAFLAGHFSLLNSISFTSAAAAIAGGLLLALFLYGLRTGGQRQPRILYPLAVGLLLYTFVLGMWLPLLSGLALPFDLPNWTDEALRFRESFLWTALFVPLIIASGLTFLLSETRAPRLFRSYGFRLLAGSLLFIYLLLAIHARATADVQAIVAYANLLPVLLCSALLALVALLGIALSHWQALRALRQPDRPAPWSQEGVVLPQAGGDHPGRLYYLGWFVGLRIQCSGFILRTSRGDLPIPPGARLLAPLPLWTTRAHSGESRAILQAGDRVRATGFVSPPAGNAFRQSGMPVPGSEGLVLWKREEEEMDVRRDLALIVWRPAILYLAIVSLVALPGLAGFFAF